MCRDMHMGEAILAKPPAIDDIVINSGLDWTVSLVMA